MVTRDEITQALAGIAPEVAALEVLATLRFSDATLKAIREIRDAMLAFRSALSAMLEAMNVADAREAALRALGYPASPTESAADAVLAEIDAMLAAFAEARAVFTQQASTMSVSLGQPEAKT